MCIDEPSTMIMAASSAPRWSTGVWSSMDSHISEELQTEVQESMNVLAAKGVGPGHENVTRGMGWKRSV